jgi:hypothetical protein
VQVVWNKCQGNVWCRLETVNLSHAHFDNMIGVYVLWLAGDTPRTVRIGHGIIRDRLQFERGEPQVRQYARFGLYVTWALVPLDDAVRVESYLRNHLRPIIPDTPLLPVAEIAVNLPWP